MFLSLHHINPEYMEKIKTHLCVTKYESMKNFFRCSFPVSKNECCSYVGSLSDVDNHFAMHTGAYRFYCWKCNQLFHEESATNTHSKNGCPRSKSEFLAHDEKLVLFHRRAKNLFIKQIDREDYKRIHEGNLQIMKSSVDKDVPTYDVSAPFNSAKRAALPDYPTRHPDHRSSRQVFDAVATPRYEDQQNLDVRSQPTAPGRSEERQVPRLQPTAPSRTERSEPTAPIRTPRPETAPVSDQRQTHISDPRLQSMSTPQECRPAQERERDLEREYSSGQRLQTSTRQQDAVPTVPAPRPDSERPASRPSAGPDRTPRSELGHVQESVDNHQSGLSTPQNEASPRTCPPRRERDSGLDRAAHQRFQETTRQQDPAPSVPAPKRNSERLAPHYQQNVGADRTPRPELGHGQKSDMSPPLNDAPPRTCLPRRGRDLELEYSADQRLQMSTRQQDSAPIVPAPRPNSVRPAPQHPQNTAPHPSVGSDRISRLEVGHGQEFVYNQQFGISTAHNQNDAPPGICPPAPRREWGSELENGAHQRFHDSDPRQDNATTPEQEASPRVCPPAPRREWGYELEHGAHQRFQDSDSRQVSVPPRPDQFESHGHYPQDSWHSNGRAGFPTPAHSPNAPLLGPPVNEVPHHHNGLQNRGPGHPLHPVWGVFGFQGNRDSRQPNGYQSGPPPFVHQQPANNQWNNNNPPNRNDFSRDYWDHQRPPRHSRSRHPSPERGGNWNRSRSRSRPQSRGPTTPNTNRDRSPHRSKSRQSRRSSPEPVVQQENCTQTAPEEPNQTSLSDLSDVRRIMNKWLSRKSSDADEAVQTTDHNNVIVHHQQSAHPLLGSPIFLPATKPKPLKELSEKDIELKADLELKARLAEMRVERYFPPPPPPPPSVPDHEHVGARQTESITESPASAQADDPPATDPATNRIHQGIQALRFTLTGQCSNRPPTSKPSPVSPPRPASVLLALKDKNIKTVDQLLRERPLQQTERVSRKRISNHDDDSNVQTQFAPDCSKPTVNARNGREESEDQAPIQKRSRPTYSETDYSPSSPTYSETSSSSTENSQRPPARPSGSPQRHQPASVSLKIQTPTQFKTTPTKIRYSRSSTDSDGSGGSIGVSVPINHTTPVKSRGTSLAVNSHGSNRNASLLTSPEKYRTRKMAHPEK
ncbi:hypothetical protein GCK72_008946 [Caenorhabditis remanei]|uniref:C2H2-type domain-containing protein n=1 Tax=Caenorhabditis remanei TaxID=31234 RepID=A0A6A5H041_CAERE|nr:hypothetical protein GCK72_008946 [Caenorhabditis remanei]KAF1760697.1 hypothetical protein GCK72_008946 [Caenorhabditis remanei]